MEIKEIISQLPPVCDVKNIVCYEGEPCRSTLDPYSETRFGAIMFDIRGKTFRAYTQDRYTDELQCIRKKRITAAKAATITKAELINRGEVLGWLRLQGETREAVNEFIDMLWGNKEVISVEVPYAIAEALEH